MTGRNSAVSSVSPPKPPSKSSRNAPHPTTRKRPRETPRPFAPRTQTFGVSGCRRCLRRVANARKVGTAQHVNTFGLGETGRYRTNVWEYVGVNSFREGRLDDLESHATVKPVDL